MTTIDSLRRDIAKAAARSQGDETPIIHTADQLRAAVAEHDALRDAVRGYLATLPESERIPTCASSHLDGSVCSVIPAAVAPGDGLPVCAEFVRRHSWTRALPPRVVALRALAALVRS